MYSNTDTRYRTRAGAGGGDEPAEPAAGTGRAARELPRWLTGALFVTLAAITAASPVRYRAPAAWLARQGVAVILGVPLGSARSGGRFVFTARHPLALQVTQSYDSALLLAPLFLVTGLLLWSGRLRVRRALTALSVAAPVVVCCDALRLVAIVAVAGRWGAGAADGWSHALIEPAFPLLGTAAALWAYVFVVGPAVRSA